METGNHPLWPTLVINRSHFNQIVENLLVHIGDFELKDNMQSWLEDARWYATQTRDVGLSIVSNGGVLSRIGLSGEVITDHMSMDDILDIYKGRINRVKILEDKIFALSGPSIRIPPGGLAGHESALHRRHTLEFHVHGELDELFERIAEFPTLPAASTFLSREYAEYAVGKTLAANDLRISEWLRSTNGRLKITYDLDAPVGFLLRRGTNVVIKVSRVYVILERDSSSPLGYWIKTAFIDK
jgi:CDI toxin RNase A-like protein